MQFLAFLLCLLSKNSRAHTGQFSHWEYYNLLLAGLPRLDPNLLISLQDSVARLFLFLVELTTLHPSFIYVCPKFLRVNSKQVIIQSYKITVEQKHCVTEFEQSRVHLNIFDVC